MLSYFFYIFIILCYNKSQKKKESGKSMFKLGPKRSCRECACLLAFDDGSGICYPNDPDAPHESYELTVEEINTPEVCDFWRKKEK